MIQTTVIDKSKPISERMAQSVIKRYDPAQMRWHYEHGLLIQSIYAVANRVNNAGTDAAGTDAADYRSWVKFMYDTKIQDDGSIATYSKEEFNLDQINPGKQLFDLYKDSGERKYRTAIETLRDQLRHHPRTKTGGFWHKQIYPWQMWLDGLYMGAPFYARYAAEFGPVEDFTDIVHQFALIESKARVLKISDNVTYINQ